MVDVRRVDIYLPPNSPMSSISIFAMKMQEADDILLMLLQLKTIQLYSFLQIFVA